MHTNEFLTRVLELAQKNRYDHEVARILTDEGYEDVKATTIAEIFSNGSLLSRGLVSKGQLADLKEMRRKRGAQRHGPTLTITADVKRSPGFVPGAVYRPGEPFYMLSYQERLWALAVQKELEAHMPVIHDHHEGCQFDLGGPTRRAGVCGSIAFGRLFGSPAGVLKNTGTIGANMKPWCVGHGMAVLHTPGRADLVRSLTKLTNLSLSDFPETEESEKKVDQAA